MNLGPLEPPDWEPAPEVYDKDGWPEPADLIELDNRRIDGEGADWDFNIGGWLAFGLGVLTASAAWFIIGMIN